MRKIKFKVCWINRADIVITLFDSEIYEQAESFALNWDGEEKELFIKKVWTR